MADKEERILIDIIEPGLNCVYRMDNNPKGLSLCKHNGEEEPVSEKDCKSCLEGMTRQEAIEIMAKGLCKFISQGECKDVCEKCNLDKKEEFFEMIVPQHFTFKDQAEAALNALLEGEKK